MSTKSFNISVAIIVDMDPAQIVAHARYSRHINGRQEPVELHDHVIFLVHKHDSQQLGNLGTVLCDPAAYLFAYRPCHPREIGLDEDTGAEAGALLEWRRHWHFSPTIQARSHTFLTLYSSSLQGSTLLLQTLQLSSLTGNELLHDLHGAISDGLHLIIVAAEHVGQESLLVVPPLRQPQQPVPQGLQKLCPDRRMAVRCQPGAEVDLHIALVECLDWHRVGVAVSDQLEDHLVRPRGDDGPEGLHRRHPHTESVVGHQGADVCNQLMATFPQPPPKDT
eukprot:scaffold175365_cov34-Prasinocladus_malaysianus.AAC.1